MINGIFANFKSLIFILILPKRNYKNSPSLELFSGKLLCLLKVSDILFHSSTIISTGEYPTIRPSSRQLFAMRQQDAPGRPGGGFYDGFAAVTFSHVSITSLAE